MRTLQSWLLRPVALPLISFPRARCVRFPVPYFYWYHADHAVEETSAESPKDSDPRSNTPSRHAEPPEGNVSSLVSDLTDAESDNTINQIPHKDHSETLGTRPSRSEADGPLDDGTEDANSEPGRQSSDDVDSGHRSENRNLILKSPWGFEQRHYRRYQWMILVTATTGYVWTVYYSYNATINPNPFLRLVQNSVNAKIFLIAFFSQINIIMITWLTHEVYNCLRWAWISRTQGTDLTTFLVLSPTTSPLALIGFLLFRIHYAFLGSETARRKRVCQPVTFFVCLR